MKTIRDRLGEIAGLAQQSLRVLSSVNLVAIVILLAASFWVQRTTAAAQDMAALALLAETQRGFVARVPAEMDLTRQTEMEKRFVETSESLAARATEAGLNLSAELAESRRSGEQVFVLARAFAQQQATAMSDGPFSKATDRLQSRIADFAQGARFSANRAFGGMLVLGVILMIVGRVSSDRARRRLAIEMDRLAASLASSIEAATQAAERIALGNLRAGLMEKPGETDETRRLTEALASMESRLQTVLGEIQLASESLHQGAQQVSSSAQALSVGSARQAASMQETTANVQQMASSISQNAQLSRLAEELANQNVSGARVGSEGMRATTLALRDVVDKASVIGELAHRTHLLSLNAAIEAARAGEHGRGFGVIAAEVRSLASKSSIALADIRRVAESSIETAERTASTIALLLPVSEKTAAAAIQVAASSSEQMTGAQQIDQAMRDIDVVTQAAAASSEELAATADAISAQAARLKSTAGFFRLASS